MKNVYITGISGLLGANLAFNLRNQYKIFGVDRNYMKMDNVCTDVYLLNDKSMIRQKLIEYKIDIVIHCAAIVNVDRCEEEPKEAYKINTELTKDIVDICNELNIKLIFISSDAVFDGTRIGLYSETDVALPISVYGKSKRIAEDIVLATSQNLVIRTNIYGFNYRNKTSFGEWILNALRSGETLNMASDIMFSPILTNDLADIIGKCIDHDVCGLYHICGTGAISKFDMALAFRDKLKVEAKINEVSIKDIKFKAPRTNNMGLDNSKIREKLGIYIKTPLESIDAFLELEQKKYQNLLRQTELKRS